MNFEQLSKTDLIALVKQLISSNALLMKKVAELTEKVLVLEAEVSELKSKKNSNNSSLPPSTDLARLNRNQSLRQKSGRKKGGQNGHKGHTLKLSPTPDVTIDYEAFFCRVCGKDLGGSNAVLLESRQVLDIPVSAPVYTEHRMYGKACLCGQLVKGSFPARVKAPIQYGPGVEAMAGYLSVRQYLPYQRMQECFQDLFGIPISQASLVSAVRRMAVKAAPVYNRIKANILKSKVVGTDETGAKVNGTKAWFWTWQNPNNTLISLDSSRGFKAIESMFTEGLPNSILVSDCWAAQLKTPAVSHQLCLAHLIRELNFFIQLYDEWWSKKLRKLLLQAIRFKNEPAYYKDKPQKKGQFKKQLEALLSFEINKQHLKIKPFHKRLLKNREYIFPFLDHLQVPADNNASERAIRNIKVKQKISGQFVSWISAKDFATLRSVIDTAVKNKTNVFNTCKSIAQIAPE